MHRAIASLSLLSLLLACQEEPAPADSALLVVASRAATPNGNGTNLADTLFLSARDLRALEDLSSLAGLLGEPTLVQGSCRGFVGGIPDFPANTITGGPLAFQGTPLDAGAITVSGASALGRDVRFDFDPDVDAYQGDHIGENPLFFPGDTLVLSGAGAGPLDGAIAGEVRFPQDVALLAPIAITQGEDAAITWNVPNDPAERVQILLSTIEADQDRVDVLCDTEDTGAFTVPGAITALLSNEALLSLGGVARINGANLGADPDAVVRSLQGGQQVQLQAVNSLLVGITVD